MESHSKTITVVEEKVSKKAKNTLYLVLKKRGFEEEVIEKMNTELERRFLEVLKRITYKYITTFISIMMNCNFKIILCY